MNGRLRGALALALGGVLSALSMGCAAATKLYVESTSRTNGGAPLYMMVRAVDDQTASLPEEYQAATTMVFAAQKDPSVVTATPLFPGKPAIFMLDRVEGKTFVVYFFFTSPGDKWRAQLASPAPAEAVVKLGNNQIDSLTIMP